VKHRLAALLVAVVVPASTFAAIGDQLTPTTTLASGALSTEYDSHTTTAMGPDGQTIVVWKARPDGETVLFSQRFDEHGKPAGSAPVALDQSLILGEVVGDPVVTVDHNNIATLVWQSSSPQDAGDIRLLRIGVDGAPLGNVVTVNTDTADVQSLPWVASDKFNNVLVTWTSPVPEGGHGLFGQIYDASGTVQVMQLRIDQAAAVAPMRSRLAMPRSASIMILWQADGPLGAKALMGRDMSTSGSLFDDAVVINQHPSLGGGDFSFAADGEDMSATVIWIDAGGLWMSRHPGGDQYPLLVDTTLPSSADVRLLLQVGEEGRGLLAWSETGAIPNRTVLQPFDWNAATSAPIDLLFSDAGVSRRIVGLAADHDNDAGITWLSTPDFSGSPQQSLNFARFAGLSDVPAEMTLSSPELVAPGENFWIYAEVLINGTNTLTGVRVEIDLDDRLRLVADPSSPEWQCEVGDPLVCTSTMVLAETLWGGLGSPSPAPSTFPLSVTAPDQRATLVNSASLTALQGDSFLLDNVAELTIEVGDGTPDAFGFGTRLGVPRASLQTSDEISLSGFDVPQQLWVNAGEYSLNGAPFGSGYTMVRAGDRLRLRHIAATGFNSRVTTSIWVGGVAGTFTTETEMADTTPDAFVFLDVANVPRGSAQISNALVVAGINDAAPINVSGGEYSINGGAFTAVGGTVTAGASVRVRHVAAAGFATAVNTTLVIGGISDTFSSTTEAADTTPSPFSFLDQAGLATNVPVVSAAIAVAGISAPTTIAIAGGAYSINGAAFTSSAGSVNNGDQIRVALQTASNSSTTVSATVTIGGVSDSFSATTGALDTTPATFSFTDVTGAKKKRAVTSNAVTVSSINTSVAISVNGAGVTYSKNGGTFTTNAGTVVNGDQVRLRITASSTSNTTLTATATIGGISDQWSVTSGTR
jgi:hypothetical protein